MTTKDFIQQIQPADTRYIEASKKYWNSLGKPLGSLGKLETQISRISGMKRGVCYELQKKALIVMCADNGVVAEGVTQTGQEVTAIVADNFTTKKTSTCLMSELAGVDIFPVDIGMVSDVPSVTKRERKVAYGTKNFAIEPAMTEEELWKAIQVGIDLVEEKKREGYDILLTGEMGIGNTTTSSALTAVLLGEKPERVTGRGAGLSSSGLERKVKVIRNAIEKYDLKQKQTVQAMTCVGGLDIAGLCGVFLGGGIYQMPVVIDGFISAAAALCAVRLVPQVLDYIVPSHVSGENGAALILKELGLSPLIDCSLTLGEGSGAVAAMPLLDMGLAVYNRMSTFEEIQVEQYEELK